MSAHHAVDARFLCRLSLLPRAKPDDDNVDLFDCVLATHHCVQDVLVVTAPSSGAEVIPFLKTYVNLPGAVAFTVLYSKLCNSAEQVNTPPPFLRKKHKISRRHKVDRLRVYSRIARNKNTSRSFFGTFRSLVPVCKMGDQIINLTGKGLPCLYLNSPPHPFPSTPPSVAKRLRCYRFVLFEITLAALSVLRWYTTSA